MKRSFSSNSQLSHVWASQTQDSGKGNNMFFNGDSIYSYGLHYKIAKIHNNWIVLINSKGYSNTTAKHTNHVHRAVSHLTTFYVPNVDNPTASENIQHLSNGVADAVNSLLTCVKVGSNCWKIQNIKYAAKLFNEYCQVFNIVDSIELDAEFLAELELVYQVKLARTKELDATREQREEQNRIKREKEYLDSVQAWQNFSGQIKGYSNQVFLRINRDKNLVETSRGASVPLPEAVKLVTLIRNGVNVIGQQIGSFTVNKLTQETLVIGCHNIPLEEMNRAFQPQGV